MVPSESSSVIITGSDRKGGDAAVFTIRATSVDTQISSLRAVPHVGLRNKPQ